MSKLSGNYVGEEWRPGLDSNQDACCLHAAVRSLFRHLASG
jgi:hypothetical protein